MDFCLIESKKLILIDLLLNFGIAFSYIVTQLYSWENLTSLPL